jgi:uncharacterized protein (DUF488 family)
VPSRKPHARPLYTVGHSRHTLEELVAILQSAGVTRVVDIRKFPRSRTNPQFNTDTLPAALRKHGIGYEHLAALGGRRGKSKQAEESPNQGWHVQAFRNYADYAASDEFRAALAELLDRAREEPCAIMCAEAVWWRCHRRIVTDHVLAHGVPVVHLMSATSHEPAELTPFAVVKAGARVTYPEA